MHARPSLWGVHATHHTAADVRWWTTFRFHPVDGALQHAVPLLVAAALGFGPTALSGYVAVVFVVTVFAHADVWVPTRIVARVVAVPAFHRTHHEVGRDNVNYGLVLPIWDWLFGTGDFNSRAGVREFPQRKTASPIASEVILATPLMSSAANGSESRRRHTSSASR
jgi:sterol desaturase/sphingolipid hydroxylase (fatty acid hydroxylase superfamily)